MSGGNSQILAELWPHVNLSRNKQVVGALPIIHVIDFFLKRNISHSIQNIEMWICGADYSEIEKQKQGGKYTFKMNFLVFRLM